MMRQPAGGKWSILHNGHKLTSPGLPALDKTWSVDDRVVGMIFSRTLGAVLAVVSLICLLVARAQLGKSFAVTPKAKELVTHGFYSKLRHPMYLFVDLTILGIALVLGLWYIAMILLILVPLQVMNAYREKKVLHDKFGERYEEYRRSTWF